MSFEPDSSRRVYEGALLGLTVERWGQHEREIVEHPGAVAVVAVDESAIGAVFKGLTLGMSGTSPRLYATDFAHGKGVVSQDRAAFT